MPAKPLTPAEATREIKRILRLINAGLGVIRFTIEAQNDAALPRDWAHDVTDYEIDNCLRNGKVALQPTYNQSYDEWTYSVELAFDTCNLLTVTAIFSEENRIQVITRYKKSKNYDKAKPKARKPR